MKNSKMIYERKALIFRRFNRVLRLLVFFIFQSFIFHSLTSCDDYDKFTTDRSAVLQFSEDQVVFDTLITTCPSSTKTLTVFNRGDAGLRIREVRLAGGADSPFRINIDGQDMSRTVDNRVTDFEVRRRDSIMVRAEVTVPEWSSDDPKPVSDQLVFTLESGVVQQVTLSAVGQDAFYLNARTLTADTTLSARRPILVSGGLTVAEGATLTMEAGTRLLFHDDAGMTVDGRLVVQGTLENPVVFRGDRTDHIFDYLPYDRLPGRWQGITVTSKSLGNELNYADIHGGTYGIVCALPENDAEKNPVTDETPVKMTLTNSVITNTKGPGLVLYDSRVTVANTEISNTLGHCVDVVGGDVTFTFCTLAQFYPLDANRGNALHIANVYDGKYHALHRGDFVNCVITGYSDDVVMGEWIDPAALPKDVSQAEENYHFINCFLATEIPTGAEFVDRFVGCVYDDPQSERAHDKNFLLMDTHALIYDFTPVSDSQIREMANPAYAGDWPLDRRGRNRSLDNGPDAGCYEYAE